MDMKINHQINSLAYHLWVSADREYGRALEFWNMAEQMVWELVVGSARLSGSVAEASVAVERKAPAMAANYAQQVRELAYLMWEAAGAQYGRAMDYWIAAERHVMTMMMASAAKNPSADADVSDESPFDQFSPATYLNAIRTAAYYMWENAGRQASANSLDFWLAAERQVLNQMETATMAMFRMLEPSIRSEPLHPSPPGAEAPEAEETASASQPLDPAVPAATSEAAPFHIRRREPEEDARTLGL